MLTAVIARMPICQRTPGAWARERHVGLHTWYVMADKNTLLFHAARLSAQTHKLQLTDLLTWKGMVCWSAHCIG